MNKPNLEKMQFTESDIKDREFLERAIKQETERLYSSNTTRRNRSKEEIEKVVRQGKVAEVFLIETGKYREAVDIYHDLIDENGDRTEVKAYSVMSSNAPSVQNDLYRIRTGNWNHSKWYILFNYNEGVYTFLEKIKI